MRAAVVLVNLVLLLFLHAADPLACPDGCTGPDHQQQSSTPQHGPAPVGDCLLCHGGLTPSLVVLVFPPPGAHISTADIDAAVLSRPTPRLEHPPRPA